LTYSDEDLLCLLNQLKQKEKVVLNKIAPIILLLV